MKKEISNYLQRFTSFMNKEPVMLNTLVGSFVSGVVGAAGLIGYSTKLLAEKSFETANAVSPTLTSMVTNMPADKLLETAIYATAASVTLVATVAAGKLLKNPAEAMSRAFGEKSISGVNDKVLKLVADGKANHEVTDYIMEALKNDKHLKNQYSRALALEPERVQAIKSTLSREFSGENMAYTGMHR
jgi:hypothetical protein